MSFVLFSYRIMRLGTLQELFRIGFIVLISQHTFGGLLEFMSWWVRAVLGGPCRTYATLRLISVLSQSFGEQDTSSSDCSHKMLSRLAPYSLVYRVVWLCKHSKKRRKGKYGCMSEVVHANTVAYAMHRTVNASVVLWDKSEGITAAGQFSV